MTERSCCLDCKAKGLDTGVSCYENRVDNCSNASWVPGYPRPVYDHDPRTCTEHPVDAFSCGCDPIMVDEARMTEVVQTGLRIS